MRIYECDELRKFIFSVDPSFFTKNPAKISHIFKTQQKPTFPSQSSTNLIKPSRPTKRRIFSNSQAIFSIILYIDFQKSMFSFYKLFIASILQELQLIDRQGSRILMDRPDEPNLFSTNSQEEESFSFREESDTYEEWREVVQVEGDGQEASQVREPVFRVYYGGKRCSISEKAQLEAYLREFLEIVRANEMMSEHQERYWEAASDCIIYWMQYCLFYHLKTGYSDVELTQEIIMQTFHLHANLPKNKRVFSISRIFLEER